MQPVTLRYALYGELNEARDNALLVCHALSGSARVADWWPRLVGPDQPFDPTHYCVIGVNVIGSCYGSTGPGSPHPQKPGQLYSGDFPVLTIRDMVRTQARLLDHLGIERLHTVIGGSIGGMQALSWAVDFSERVERCIAIGAAPLPAMGLALNHLNGRDRNDPAGGTVITHWIKPCGLALALLSAFSYNRQNFFRSGLRGALTEREIRRVPSPRVTPSRAFDYRLDLYALSTRIHTWYLEGDGYLFLADVKICFS